MVKDFTRNLPQLEKDIPSTPAGLSFLHYLTGKKSSSTEIAIVVDTAQTEAH